MLHLLRDYDMPVFTQNVNDNNIRILLDTGANLSVFNGTEDGLFDYFEDVSKSKYTTFINGFGGNTKILPVYTLPKLMVDKTVIHNVLAVCHEFDMDIDLILAGTLLKKSPFKIDLDAKILEVEDIGRDVYCIPVQAEETPDGKHSIHSTTVFLQEG